MKQPISIKNFILFVTIAGVIHATFLIFVSSIGVIIGLLIGTFEIDLLNSLRKQNPIYIFILALINVGITTLFITSYCFFFFSVACDRNPILLSVTPAVPLTLFGLSLLLTRFISWIKFLINK